MVEDKSCPQCHSDSYLNPNIKIFVSPCYHRMCENCVMVLFKNGEGACPECGTILRKINFTSQQFEDISVERECRIRKMLNKIFNLSEDDFSNENMYEDYKERYEDMIVELMGYKNDIEVSKYIETLKTDTSIHKPVESVKRRKVSSNIISPIESLITEDKSVDPYKDIEKPNIVLKRPPALPTFYQFENNVSGYNKRIMAYRAVYALLDDNI